MSIEVRVFTFDSDEYLKAVNLRYRILREPLGLKFTPEDRIKDSGDIHIGAFQGAELVGTLTLSRISNQEIKMRQVAIEDFVQGKGVGRRLVVASEQFAIINGFQRMLLNARETAVPFYEKLGYLTAPGIFNEVGIPHRKMSKELK